MALPDLVCPVKVLLDWLSPDLELKVHKTNLKFQWYSAKRPGFIDTLTASHQEWQREQV